MKSFITILLFTFSLYSFSQSTIGNLDFEDGDFTNWIPTTGSVGVTSASPHPFVFVANGITDSGLYNTASHFIVDSLKYDSKVPRMSTLCPFTNSKTLRLGDFNGAGEADRINTLLTVTVSDTLLDFFYSYVALNPVHPLHKNSYFYFEILDSSSGSLTLLDSMYISADSSVLSQDTTPGYVYSGWVHKPLNLSSYLGMKIMIRLTNGDCGYGGHGGRLYVDFSGDSKLSISNALVCNGDSALFRGNYFKNAGFYYDTTFVGSVVDSVFVFNVTVLNQNAISPVLANYSLTGCSNELITINCNANSTGADSTKYNWFVNGVSTLTTPSFSTQLLSGTKSIYCQVSNYENGCIKTELSDTITITINPAPLVNLTLAGADIVANVTGGTSPFNYKWYRNTIVQTSTTSTITPIISGNFNVVVTDSNGCVGRDTVFNYGVSLNELNSELNFNFFPNPATNSIYLELNGDKGLIEIIDVQGKLVQSIEVKSDGELNFEDLEKGIYLIRFTTESDKVVAKKLLIE